MQVKHSRIAISLLLCFVLLAAVMVTVACGGETTETTAVTQGGTDTTTVTTPGGKDEIVIGAARPQTGPLSVFEESSFGPCYKLWAEEVNADGGIYVEEYGKKLPVRMLVYDDESNLDTSMSLLEKLMVEDKVDFIFSPASTDFVLAAAALTNEHGYLMIGAEGSISRIRFEMDKYPLFVETLNYSEYYHMPRLLQTMKKVGAATAAILYPEDDPQASEYLAMFKEEVEVQGDVQVVLEAAIPADTTDFAQVLRQAQDSGADCLFVPCQPQWNSLMVTQMIQMGYNPKMLVMGTGASFGAFEEAVGGAAEGICTYGAWSINSSPELAAMRDRLLSSPTLKAEGFSESNVDYWGDAYFMGSLELFG